MRSKLDRVTITGADESVLPEDLARLSEEFPFVEWGILVSANNTGTERGKARFPCQPWIQRLVQLSWKRDLRLSLHLCGKCLRDLVAGKVQDLPIWLGEKEFQRVQLNFHGQTHEYNPQWFRSHLLNFFRGKQIIFQIDGHDGQSMLEDVWAGGDSVDAVPLFDRSHGTGVLADEWKTPLDLTVYHGYAGGLGPDNLEEQIPNIAVAAAGTLHWIDMESGVRSGPKPTHVWSPDCQIFDLTKVRRCLEIAGTFIK